MTILVSANCSSSSCAVLVRFSNSLALALSFSHSASLSESCTDRLSLTSVSA